MDDVYDDIKVLASDVFEDAANRELFLCYHSKLCCLWLKKEVVKLEFSCLLRWSAAR